jgi:5-methylcytosine-specific restriction endonuclease McrA
MTVGRIVSRDEAVRIRKRNDLYDAGEWAIGEQGSGTALHQHRQLAPEITRQLRFVSGPSATAKALLLVNDRDIDRQTIRGVRELTPESASLLDEIIEMTEVLPHSNDPTIISDEQLRRYRIQRDLALALYEQIQDGVYVEGSVKRVLVNRYERDPGAREMCIRHHGTACSACGFDFTAAYGEVADGFIHVHHLILLSDIGPDYVVNPVEHLRPVCPNCHAIIHRRSPPYSIEDVQRFLESGRSGGR